MVVYRKIGTKEYLRVIEGTGSEVTTERAQGSKALCAQFLCLQMTKLISLFGAGAVWAVQEYEVSD